MKPTSGAKKPKESAEHKQLRLEEEERAAEAGMRFCPPAVLGAQGPDLAFSLSVPGAERLRLEAEAEKQAQDDKLRRQCLAEKRQAAQDAQISADRCCSTDANLCQAHYCE